MFTFVHVGGPYGDETSKYEVNLDREYSVKDFVNTVLTSCENEYGDISINKKEVDFFDRPCIRYRYGKINGQDFFEESLLNKKVVSVVACGGWSLMDYILNIEE